MGSLETFLAFAWLWLCFHSSAQTSPAQWLRRASPPGKFLHPVKTRTKSKLIITNCHHILLFSYRFDTWLKGIAMGIKNLLDCLLNSLTCFPIAQRYCLVRPIFQLNNLRSHTNFVRDGVYAASNTISCQPLRALNLWLATDCHQVAVWLRLGPSHVPEVRHESTISPVESIRSAYRLCHVIGPVKHWPKSNKNEI